MSRNQWKVTGEQSGISLLQFLKAQFKDTLSGRKIKQAIESNCCQINGRVERHASVKLRPGCEITFNYEDVKTPKTAIEPPRIIFQDDQLFVYDKPAGITSDDEIFKDYKLVHRLDKSTTGVIVFAKTAKAEKWMINLFRSREVDKKYLALVDGFPIEKSGLIENNIGKLDERQWAVVKAPKGRVAITRWICTEKGKTAAIMECYPKTGRTHQIRLHMKEIGHPILGDFNYVRSYSCEYLPKRCMLHAAKISFMHPETGKKVAFKAPLPEDFREAIERVI